MTLSTLLANKFVAAAISGAVAAAIVDVHAFLTFTSFGEVKSYKWGTAAFRWVQGAVGGLLTAGGIGLVS